MFEVFTPGELDSNPMHDQAEPRYQWMKIALSTFHSLSWHLGVGTEDIFFQECLLEMDKTWGGCPNWRWPL